MVQARKEAPAETLPGIRSAWAKKSDVRLEGPCSQIVYTLALKHSLYRYIGPKVYTIWVHGPLGNCPWVRGPMRDSRVLDLAAAARATRIYEPEAVDCAKATP